jgi:hypothetical protein
MIATANALLEATQQSIFDDEAMEVAQMITHTHNDLDNEQLAKALFLYATIIASNSVDKTAKVLMTKDDFINLIDTIDEIESMKNEVLNGK